MLRKPLMHYITKAYTDAQDKIRKNYTTKRHSRNNLRKQYIYTVCKLACNVSTIGLYLPWNAGSGASRGGSGGSGMYLSVPQSEGFEGGWGVGWMLRDNERNFSKLFSRVESSRTWPQSRSHHRTTPHGTRTLSTHAETKFTQIPIFLLRKSKKQES